MIMETSTLNLILGMGFGFISFAFAFKWIIEAIIQYRMVSGSTPIVSMTAEEFEKMMMEEDDEEY